MHIYPTRHTVTVSIPTAAWQKKTERIDAHVALLAFRPLILHNTLHSCTQQYIHTPYATCSLRYFS